MGNGPAKGALAPNTHGIVADGRSAAERAAAAAAIAVDEVVARCRAPSEASAAFEGEGTDEAAAEHLLRYFLQDALHEVPLPSPWTVAEDSEGEVYFTDGLGNSTWEHPLSDALVTLADVFMECVSLPQECRAATVKAACQQWEANLVASYDQWYAVTDQDGRKYYCNSDTGETSWEHPATAHLPAQYMRLRAVSWLVRDSYLEGLQHLADGKAACNEVHISCFNEELKFLAQKHGDGFETGSVSVAQGASPCKEEMFLPRNISVEDRLEGGFHHGNRDDINALSNL